MEKGFKPQSSLARSSFCAKWCGFFKNDTNNETVQLQKIFYLRVLLIASLVSTAAICSVLSYTILSENEVTRFSTQYDSLSDSALNSVADSFDQMNAGLKEMSTTYSYIFPNENSWPNVAWPGFLPAAAHLGKLSALENIAFTPIVWPHQIPDYEVYMGNYYREDGQDVRSPPMPGLQLGQLWSLTLPNRIPYRETDGVIVGSNLKYVTPVAQYTISEIYGPIYLSYNLRNTMAFAPALDKVMVCVNSTSNATVARSSCGAISDTIGLPFPLPTETDPKPIQDMQALLVHPIFPGKNSSTLVGMIFGSMSWKQLLLRAVPTFVSGLDCVIITGKHSSFTYTITDGIPVFRGVGDLHDTQYNHYRRTRALDTQVAQVSSNSTYEIVFYPRRALLETYTSNVPIIAAVMQASEKKIHLDLTCDSILITGLVQDYASPRQSVKRRLRSTSTTVEEGMPDDVIPASLLASARTPTGALSTSPFSNFVSVKPTVTPRSPTDAANSGGRLNVQVHPGTAEGSD
eukprot:gene10226-11969_t